MQVLTKNNSSGKEQSPIQGYLNFVLVALGRLKGDLDIWKSDLRKRQQCLYSDCDKIKKIAFDVMKTMEDKEFLSKTILDLKVGVKSMYDSVEPLKEIIDSVSKDSLDYDFKISTASRAIKDLYLSMLSYKEKTNKHHFDDNDEDPLTAIVELCPKIHELFESGKARWDDEKKKMQGELHQYKEELHKHVLAVSSKIYHTFSG
jgi:chromosome segregation ATPase